MVDLPARRSGAEAWCRTRRSDGLCKY